MLSLYDIDNGQLVDRKTTTMPYRVADVSEPVCVGWSARTLPNQSFFGEIQTVRIFNTFLEEDSALLSSELKDVLSKEQHKKQKKEEEQQHLNKNKNLTCCSASSNSYLKNTYDALVQTWVQKNVRVALLHQDGYYDTCCSASERRLMSMQTSYGICQTMTTTTNGDECLAINECAQHGCRAWDAVVVATVNDFEQHHHQRHWTSPPPSAPLRLDSIQGFESLYETNSYRDVMVGGDEDDLIDRNFEPHGIGPSFMDMQADDVVSAFHMTRGSNPVGVGTPERVVCRQELQARFGFGTCVGHGVLLFNPNDNGFISDMTDSVSIRRATVLWPRAHCAALCLLSHVQAIQWHQSSSSTTGCSGFALYVEKNADTRCLFKTAGFVRNANDLSSLLRFSLLYTIDGSGDVVVSYRVRLDEQNANASPPPPLPTINQSSTTFGNLLPVHYDFYLPPYKNLVSQHSSEFGADAFRRDDSFSWGFTSASRAQKVCKRVGGTLPQPRSLDQLDHLWNAFQRNELHRPLSSDGAAAMWSSTPQSLWMGISRSTSDEPWLFQDGTPLPYAVTSGKGQLLIAQNSFHATLEANAVDVPVIEDCYSSSILISNFSAESGSNVLRDCPHVVIQAVHVSTSNISFLLTRFYILRVQEDKSWKVILGNCDWQASADFQISNPPRQPLEPYVGAPVTAMTYHHKSRSLILTQSQHRRVLWVDVDESSNTYLFTFVLFYGNAAETSSMTGLVGQLFSPLMSPFLDVFSCNPVAAITVHQNTGDIYYVSETSDIIRIYMTNADGDAASASSPSLVRNANWAVQTCPTHDFNNPLPIYDFSSAISPFSGSAGVEAVPAFSDEATRLLITNPLFVAGVGEQEGEYIVCYRYFCIRCSLNAGQCAKILGTVKSTTTDESDSFMDDWLPRRGIDSKIGPLVGFAVDAHTADVHVASEHFSLVMCVYGHNGEIDLVTGGHVRFRNGHNTPSVDSFATSGWIVCDSNWKANRCEFPPKTIVRTVPWYGKLHHLAFTHDDDSQRDGLLVITFRSHSTDGQLHHDSRERRTTTVHVQKTSSSPETRQCLTFTTKAEYTTPKSKYLDAGVHEHLLAVPCESDDHPYGRSHALCSFSDTSSQFVEGSAQVPLVFERFHFRLSDFNKPLLPSFFKLDSRKFKSGMKQPFGFIFTTQLRSGDEGWIFWVGPPSQNSGTISQNLHDRAVGLRMHGGDLSIGGTQSTPLQGTNRQPYVSINTGWMRIILFYSGRGPVQLNVNGIDDGDARFPMRFFSRTDRYPQSEPYTFSTSLGQNLFSGNVRASVERLQVVDDPDFSPSVASSKLPLPQKIVTTSRFELKPGLIQTEPVSTTKEFDVYFNLHNSHFPPLVVGEVVLFTLGNFFVLNLTDTRLRACYQTHCVVASFPPATEISVRLSVRELKPDDPSVWQMKKVGEDSRGWIGFDLHKCDITELPISLTSPSSRFVLQEGFDSAVRRKNQVYGTKETLGFCKENYASWCAVATLSELRFVAVGEAYRNFQTSVLTPTGDALDSATNLVLFFENVNLFEDNSFKRDSKELTSMLPRRSITTTSWRRNAASNVFVDVFIGYSGFGLNEGACLDFGGGGDHVWRSGFFADGTDLFGNWSKIYAKSFHPFMNRPVMIVSTDSHDASNIQRSVVICSIISSSTNSTSSSSSKCSSVLNATKTTNGNAIASFPSPQRHTYQSQNYMRFPSGAGNYDISGLFSQAHARLQFAENVPMSKLTPMFDEFMENKKVVSSFDYPPEGQSLHISAMGDSASQFSRSFKNCSFLYNEGICSLQTAQPINPPEITPNGATYNCFVSSSTSWIDGCYLDSISPASAGNVANDIFETQESGLLSSSLFSYDANVFKRDIYDSLGSSHTHFKVNTIEDCKKNVVKFIVVF